MTLVILKSTETSQTQRTFLDWNGRKSAIKVIVVRGVRRTLHVDLGAVNLGIGVGSPG